MPARFEIKRAKDKEYFFNLVAPNGEVILTSEMYKGKTGARKGVAAVQTNAADPITIDDQELSSRQFSRLLTTYAGWGMRIVFVPDDELADPPRIEVREPEEDGPGSNGGIGRPQA